MSDLSYPWVEQGGFQSVIALPGCSVHLFLKVSTRQWTIGALPLSQCLPIMSVHRTMGKWTHGCRSSAQAYTACLMPGQGTLLASQTHSLPVDITTQRSSQKPLLEDSPLGKGVSLCSHLAGLSSVRVPIPFLSHQGFLSQIPA